METIPSLVGRSTRKPRRSRWLLLVLLLFLAVLSLSAYYWMLYFYPNKEYVEPDYGSLQKPMFYRGEVLDWDGAGQAEALKLPITFVKNKLDPYIHVEEPTQSVIITTKDKVVRMKSDLLTATVNEKPITLQFPLEKINSDYYLPIEPLKQLYGLEIRESEETGHVILHLEGETVQWGKADEAEQGVQMRLEPGIKSPIVADLQPGEPVMIWSDKNDWFKIQQQNGTVGYARKQDITLDQIETIPAQSEQSKHVPWKPLGGKINLTWEHVTSRNPDTSKIGPMPGLNVVSPTWFSIIDGVGNLKNMADASYVKWAHSNGWQVWALFSNSFDPDLTTQALADYDKRMKMIKQLLAFARMYDLNGINIDFENVYLKDKDKLTQFVREMTPLLHEEGLVVSIDVTFKSTSEMWSMFYDRKALAETVDYMMVMAYDEHWASSPVSGSVSSLPWVEKSLQRILQEDQVPPSKLVLGIPFYTRIWTEETKDGKTAVSSRAVYMSTVDRIINENQLTPVFSPETGQFYVEYMENGKRNRIWIEDETSVKARLDIVKKYNLAGVASWRRGFETPNIWNVIKETMEVRP